MSQPQRSRQFTVTVLLELVLGSDSGAEHFLFMYKSYVYNTRLTIQTQKWCFSLKTYKTVKNGLVYKIMSLFK